MMGCMCPLAYSIPGNGNLFQVVVPTEAMGEVHVGTFFLYIIINPPKTFCTSQKKIYLLKFLAVQKGLIL
jgi:hypothetical protein